MIEGVTAKLTPVCECGYVFGDGDKITKDTHYILKNGELKEYGTIYRIPNGCPNCKKQIHGIVVDDFFREEFEDDKL